MKAALLVPGRMTSPTFFLLDYLAAPLGMFKCAEGYAWGLTGMHLDTVQPDFTLLSNRLLVHLLYNTAGLVCGFVFDALLAADSRKSKLLSHHVALPRCSLHRPCGAGFRRALLTLLTVPRAFVLLF